MFVLPMGQVGGMVVELLAALGAHLQRHRHDLFPAAARKFLPGRFLFRICVVRAVIAPVTVHVAFPGPTPFPFQRHIRNFETLDGPVVEVLLLRLQIV